MRALAEKVAIVTGASRGIGRAIAERLARDGAAVIVNYNHSVREARDVVQGIENRGGRAFAAQADIGKVPDLRRLFKDSITLFGHVDIVVNELPADHSVQPAEAATPKECAGAPLRALYGATASGL